MNRRNQVGDFMSFILTILFSAFVSVFVIHKLANLLKFSLFLRPLLACALCAVTVDLALTLLSLYLPKFQLPTMLFVTLLSAYYIADYNAYLARLDESKRCRRFFPPDEEAAAMLTAEDLPPRAYNVEEAETFDFSALAAMLTPISSAGKNEAERQKGDKLAGGATLEERPTEKDLPAVENGTAQEAPPAAALDLVEIYDEAEAAGIKAALFAQKSSAAPKEGDAVPLEENRQTTPAEESVQQNTRKEPPSAEVSGTKLGKPAGAGGKGDAASSQNEAYVQDRRKNGRRMGQIAEKGRKTEAVIKKLATLIAMNDILDYAYELQSGGEPRHALLAYQKALATYEDDDYAPFIVIDIGNLYKAEGDYIKSIEAYTDALHLPALTANDVLRKEFINNIAYLRLLRSILQDRNSLHLRFSEIPQEILAAAETKFQQWRTQHL